MFKSGQDIAKKPEKTLKNGFLKTGMPLAKDIRVNRRITYKEITLILGIVVAVLVAITLWVMDPSANGKPSHTMLLPEIQPVVLAKSFIYTLADLIF